VELQSIPLTSKRMLTGTDDFASLRTWSVIGSGADIETGSSSVSAPYNAF